MLGFNTLKVPPKKIFHLIKDFEAYCLGEKYLSPEDFRTLNEELSLGAVLHIGRHKFQHKDDGRHLIWIDPNNETHDLGPVSELNVMRDYPGFHRYRSLALGHEKVESCEVIESGKAHPVTMVKMTDGTIAFGTNYRTALRNAALKMRLKHAFLRANPAASWRNVYGQG